MIVTAKSLPVLAVVTFLQGAYGSSGGAASACSDYLECEELYGPGSVCRYDGKCTVPDLYKGCLQSMLPEWTKKRVCNSDDPPDAAERGLCDPAEFPYTEIRLFGGNWESRILQTWVAQIMLSELMGVPTTVEAGVPDATIDFYDSSKPLNLGESNITESFLRAGSIRDCTLASRHPENYEPCAHVILEVWSFGVDEYSYPVRSDLYEPPTSVGMLGQESIFVTKFTVENDTRFASYFGLQGEEMRETLAETFLRPTTWKDYCEQVSLDNCTTDDGVAKRYPQGWLEEVRMYVGGAYTGHFRATEENDCSLNNETFKCTGHIGDFPCGWTSFVEAQMYHLGIPLQSSGNEPNSRGYYYFQLVDMWHAANATKSNLMIYWWSPETMYEQYRGTDTEMIRVTFPVPTIECEDNRVDAKDTCSDSMEKRIGNPLGACETPITPLMKLFVSSLEQISKNPKAPEAIHSPAHEMLRLFQFTEYQLAEISRYIAREPSYRQAVCRWASDNMDYLQNFVPTSYPRTIEGDEHSVLNFVSPIVAAFVACLVVVTGWIVHKERGEEAIKLAQIGFLQLLLAGSFLISVGAVLQGVMPSTFTCIAPIWFINVGYALELVPLIVKVGAICRIMQAAHRMQRTVVSREKLYGVVGAILFVILIYLAVWTGVDPPQEQVEYSLTSQEMRNATVVRTSSYCSSDSNIWEYVAVGWNGLLLFTASVWAFQMRQTHKKLNETGTLAFLIYSHFVFVMFRIVTFMLSGRVEEHLLRHTRSLIYSVDTLATILIYFVPKFAATRQASKRIKKSGGFNNFVSRRKFNVDATHQPQTTTVGQPGGMTTYIDPRKSGTERSTQMENSAFVKVDIAEIRATKDILLSMKKVNEEASPEIVVSRMMETIKGLSGSLLDGAKNRVSTCVEAHPDEAVNLLGTVGVAPYQPERMALPEDDSDGKDATEVTSRNEDKGVVLANSLNDEGGKQHAVALFDKAASVKSASDVLTRMSHVQQKLNGLESQRLHEEASNGEKTFDLEAGASKDVGLHEAVSDAESYFDDEDAKIDM